MRAQVLAIAVWAGFAASTAAIPYIPPPQPIYEAPIDRALQNVAAIEARNDVAFIVVPLSERALQDLVDNESNVPFDFAGTGDARAQGWLSSEAAWLVWDPEWRGDVRSGFDMIGQRTWSVFWRDGFEAMRALDDNRDGELTGAELGGLSLWRDTNGNGVSDPGEVLPANVHGIAGLSVRGEPTRRGLITAPNGVRFEDGRTRPLYDWTPGLDRAAIG